MEYLNEFIKNFFLLTDAMSIYIIVGLFFAGILKQLIPDDFISKNLGKDSTSSVIKATIFGIPLPVCSCSVIPIAQGLKKEGASKGAVQSFLISTPITGVDSILATFSFFGLIFTIFRIVSSVIIAIIVGLIQNLVENKNNEDIVQENSCCSSTSSCCSSNEKKEEVKPQFFTTKPIEEKETSCCSSTASSSCCSSNEKKSFSIKAVFTYAYVTLFSDMVKALAIGLILGALFTSFVPKEYSSLLFENQYLTYFVILIFAIPLYTCATASLPIAAAFMLQGMSAGAAFIFLTAGPATSAVTMSVVYKMLGKTSLIIYVLTISILSLVFGFGFDLFFDNLDILSLNIHQEESSFIHRLFSYILLVLIFYYLIKPYLKKESKSCCSSTNSCCGD